MPEINLQHPVVYVRQSHELAEFFGFETRNKYKITGPRGEELAFAAEQQKGLWNLLVRQYLGHWRSFTLHFFTPNRQLFLVARHPFRFFFQRLEISDAHERPLGFIQQRFSIFRKRFDVLDQQGNLLMEVASPIWKIWTFPFVRRGRQVAVVRKKWAGLLSEGFTDKDNFAVEFEDSSLSAVERQILLASAIFIDLQYFERKAD